MQADFEYSTLSLSQRAHIIAKQADEVYSALIIIILILGILVILNLITTPLVDIVDIILFTAIAAYIVIVIVYAVFGLKHLTRLLKGWNKDYLQQSYILVFDTTVPKGNTNAEKIFNLATAVFPELGGFIPAFWPAPINRLNLYLKSVVKKLRRRVTIPKTLNYRVDSYLLDLVLETDSGLFIIKDFKDSIVKFDDLNQLKKIIDNGFYHEIFRVICVAKHYDQPFLDRESLETLMKKDLKPKFSVDLLIEEDGGYTAIWIN